MTIAQAGMGRVPLKRIRRIRITRTERYLTQPAATFSADRCAVCGSVAAALGKAQVTGLLGISPETLEAWIASGRVHLRPRGDVWLVCAGTFAALVPLMKDNFLAGGDI